MVKEAHVAEEEQANREALCRDDRIEAWRERVAIVRFSQGFEMTDRQAQRIVQRQMGLSGEEALELSEMDKRQE